MSGTPPSDGEAALAAAFETPAREMPARKPKAKAGAAKPSGADKPSAPKPPSPRVPEILPDEAPVKALGTKDGDYFYLDALGQLRRLTADKHGRTHILDVFGGNGYLRATWPAWEYDAKSSTWLLKGDFDHGKIAPVMIESCHRKGVWDPADKVRGCGTWAEEDGSLVMHCGGKLWRSIGGSIIPEDAGVQGDLLYPRRPNLPEPDFKNTSDAGPRLLDTLETWSWKREADPKLALGWNVCALLGQAPPWRPAIWVTGGKGTGKSTLVKLFEWLHSKTALIMPTNTTQAYVYQKIGDSSLPVALDEFEAKDDNRRQQDVIELMRIAASGGELGRGGSENNPKTYVLKSCFSAFSILVPPLSPQDISRMAILHLGKLPRASDDEPELDMSTPGEYDFALGARERWTKTGKQLRGRVLQQWPRFLNTFVAYFRALQRAGHDARAASQFGALGAGYDIAMFDTLDPANATAWAEMLPASDLAETKGYGNEPENCLQHLLAARTDLVRSGSEETVSHYLRQARRDILEDKKVNDPSDANRVLAKIGIAVKRDRTLITTDEKGREQPVWWVYFSSTHPELGKIFKGTHWKGRAGAPGTWAQALKGLRGAHDRAVEQRIDGPKHWCTKVMWDGVFPPFDAEEDREEIETVDARDRQQTSAEKRAGTA